MIIADLDRANSRIASLEHRNVSFTFFTFSHSCGNLITQEILRAEIETIRSESGTTERLVLKRCIKFGDFDILLNTYFRVKALESQIAELEAECEGLSQSLEAQKVRTTEMEGAGVKRAKELTKEVQKKVKFITCPVELKFHFLQSSEVDQLRFKLKQLDDYDEIKRELEIMKVSSLFSVYPAFVIIIHQFVEFSGFDVYDDEEKDSTNGYENGYLPNPDTSNQNFREGKSLELLLATKNKRMQEELTKLRACRYLQSQCFAC